MAGSLFSKNVFVTSLKDLLMMVALPAGSCTTQDSLVLKTLRIHGSPHVVYIFATLGRDFQGVDVFIGDSEVSMTLANSG